MKFKSKKEELAHEIQYMEFLRKRLDSASFRANVTEEEYKKTKEKYDKVKFRIKILKG